MTIKKKGINHRNYFKITQIMINYQLKSTSDYFPDRNIRYFSAIPCMVPESLNSICEKREQAAAAAAATRQTFFVSNSWHLCTTT